MLGVDRRLLTAENRPWIAVAVAAGLASVALSVALYALVGLAIDRALAGGDARALGPWLALVVVLKLLSGGLDRYASRRASAATQVAVRDRLYAHALELGPARLDRERTGEAVYLAGEGMGWLEELLGTYWVRFLVGLMTPPLLVAYVATVDGPTALALLVAVPLTPAFLGMTGRRFRAVSERYFAAASGLAARFLDSVQGLETLQLFGRAEARGDELEAETEGLRRKTMRLLAVNQLVLFVVDWGFALGTTAVAAAMAAWRLGGGHVTPGEAVLLVLLSVELARPLNLIGAFFFAGAIGRSVAKKVAAFLDEEPPDGEREDGERENSAAPATFEPEIELEDVRFAYDEGARPALAGASLRVAPGETVALVGPSGAGKSTLLGLLPRFFDPQAGEVRLGGLALADLPLEWLRRQVALVPQDPYLFHGTIAENLRVARPDASAAELEAAARAAALHDAVAALPAGYDTAVGERGLELSGGQAQRLAIARALLRDAPVVLLDEPTSQVDAAAEAEIRDALARLGRGRTVIVVAHRLSTARAAGRIAVLDGGRVVESGTHAELLEKGGLYARLAAAGEAGS